MDKTAPKTTQYVNTGEVRSGGGDTILYSGAIGSCIVITAYDPAKEIGTMAHVMLPGISPANNMKLPTRYAANAVEEMLNQLKILKVKKENIEVCIVGGANVLKRKNDTIGKNNLESVKTLLRENQLEIQAESSGGFERRTVLFDIEKGCIYYTLGDSKQKILSQSSRK